MEEVTYVDIHIEGITSDTADKIEEELKRHCINWERIDREDKE